MSLTRPENVQAGPGAGESRRGAHRRRRRRPRRRGLILGLGHSEVEWSYGRSESKRCSPPLP